MPSQARDCAARFRLRQSGRERRLDQPSCGEDVTRLMTRRHGNYGATVQPRGDAPVLREIRQRPPHNGTADGENGGDLFFLEAHAGVEPLLRNRRDDPRMNQIGTAALLTSWAIGCNSAAELGDGLLPMHRF